MNECQQAMIAEACRRYGEIQPCSGKPSLEECFTHEGKYGVILWFNTPDGNMHVVKEEEICK